MLTVKIEWSQWANSANKKQSESAFLYANKIENTQTFLKR